MIKNMLSLGLGLALTLVASTAGAFTLVPNDLIVIIQEGNTELLVNLGPTSGDTIDLTTRLASLPDFGGNLDGARVVALSLPDPTLFIDIGFGPLSVGNFAFTSLTDPTGLIADFEIASATGQLNGWFAQITPAAVTDVIPASSLLSYTNNLGFGNDAIGNAIQISTAGFPTGGALTLDVYHALQGFTDLGGPPQEIVPFGTLIITGNTLSYVPEPGTMLLLGMGLAGLASFGRRARQS